MQHHTGSWYLPWGVPLQKMLAVPFQHPVPPGYPAQQQTPPQCQLSAVPQQQTAQQQQPQPQQPQPTAQQQVQVQQNYSQHQLHQAALHHHNSTIALQQQQQLQHHPQALHPAAAAAMFTPLTLRTFLTPSHSHIGMPQQTLTPSSAVALAATAGVHHQNAPQPQTQQNQQQLPTNAVVTNQTQSQLAGLNLNVGVVAMRQANAGNVIMPVKKMIIQNDKDKLKLVNPEKRKAEENDLSKDLKKAKLETKALKAKRPGFTDERYHETSYYIENGLRKVYPYYFTFTTFTKGRWVGEKILDVFAREFRAHPAEEYERCIKAGTLTVNYDKVPIDYRLKHNDLLANIVHRHEVPVTSQPITIVHMDDDIVVVNKPASIPVHPCGRYRHNTVVFILAKEYNLKNLRTIHRLDRLTSGLLLFGRSPKKARQMEHQIRNRQVQKEYVCRVDGEFPDGNIECNEPIEVVSYKIGVCKVSSKGKECTTFFQKLGYNGKTSVVLCKPKTGRMHQIRVHLQYLGYPVVNDPLYNHEVFGPKKGRGGDIGGKTDEQLVKDLINIHNAENWLGIDGDSELSLFKQMKPDSELTNLSNGNEKININNNSNILSDDETESVSRESSPCSESPRPVSLGSESPLDMNNLSNNINNNNNNNLINNNNNNNTNNNNNNTSGVTHQSIGTSTSFSSSTSKSSSIMTTMSSFSKAKVTVATQTGHDSPDLSFNGEKMTTDKHCYECKVRYRDPKPQDLVMYLHAWKYKGPGWEYETELPNWANVELSDADYIE